MNTSVQCPFGKDWEVIRKIGAGSYGEVYLIEKQIGTSKGAISSAMKIIRLPSSEAELELLMRRNHWSREEAKAKYTEIVNDALHEIKLLNDLRGHSHIVNYDDYTEIEHSSGVGSDLYIRMEYLTPLDFWMGERNITFSDIVRMGIEICEALEICERHGIVHKDIKPDNILVSKDGAFKLGDFGIAQTITNMLQSNNQMMGSLNYLAPEVFNNRDSDHRVDIYGLGMVMYRLLNDRRIPFLPDRASEDDAETARQRRFKGEQIPRPAHCLDALWNIIHKACEFDPNLRYSNATEMKKALLSITELPGLGETIIISNKQATREASKHRSQTPDHKGEATPGRTTSPRNEEEKADNSSKTDESDDDRYFSDDHSGSGKKTRMWILIGAASVCCIIALIAFMTMKGKDDKNSQEPIKLSAESTPFSIFISAKGGHSPYDVTVTCGDYLIEEFTQRDAEFEIDKLAPNTDYVVRLTDSQGNETELLKSTDECDAYNAEEFRYMI